MVAVVLASACVHTQTVATVGNEPMVYESRPVARNFVPFGAGQFQNDEPVKGAAFAAGQGVTGAASVGLFIYLSTHYSHGVVPVDEAWRVRHLQQLEIASGCAFVGLYAWSVIDGLAHHHSWVRIAPIVGAGGAGVALSWSQ